MSSAAPASKRSKEENHANGNSVDSAISKHIVMVTGGSGLVGKGIQIALQKEKEGLSNGALIQPVEEWVFLSSKDGDLRDQKATRAIFERVKPTHVIHLAARVGGLFANMKYKVEFFRENVQINDNVMECCREFDVKKLVS
jgi:GDP-L-fucose synthase